MQGYKEVIPNLCRGLNMEKETLLSPDQLYRQCSTELLPFKTTETLEPYAGFFGQERAIEAMEFRHWHDPPRVQYFRDG